MSDTIGTCSLCGGRVVRHTSALSVVCVDCEECGATATHPHGPVIPMKLPEPVPPMTLKDVHEQYPHLFPQKPA